MNHKKLRRLYAEERLQVRRRVDPGEGRNVSTQKKPTPAAAA